MGFWKLVQGGLKWASVAFTGYEIHGIFNSNDHQAIKSEVEMPKIMLEAAKEGLIADEEKIMLVSGILILLLLSMIIQCIVKIVSAVRRSAKNDLKRELHI